ncbi:hypothetical protein BGZ49_009593 [Haplosporangium sp. Z 27]|nr:hypothetical protein BGZ49_009593 [Haplosporangium sp. Z 27]
MKFTLSLTVLALVASQAMAVVPIPIKGCTKTVVVQTTDTGCQDFATKNGCTFQQLLAWNTKLRTDCANLDVGAPLCVSISKAGGSTTSHATAAPTAAPTSAPSTAAPKTKTPASTSSAASNITTSAAPTQTVAKTSGVSKTRSSMVLASIGVLASVVYML